MALQKCNECGHEISGKSDKCPSCDAPQKPKRYGSGTLIFVVLFGGFLVYFFTGNNNFRQVNDDSNFRQVGYLKDNGKNRIFTIAYKPGTTEQEVRSHAERLMYTQGQVMAAYFYPEGSLIPADGVTLAGSMFKANDVLFETPGLSKWRYAYMRYLKGTSEFVDCEKTADNDLCRKK